MKKLSIIGNWKSYKTASETKEWFDHMSTIKDSLPSEEEKEIVVCVPFTSLSLAKSLGDSYSLSIHIGSQDISQFDEGKYTGAVNGKQIQEFATRVIIGHSERRKNFGDTDAIVKEKIQKAFTYNLKPVVCISEIAQVQSFADMIGEKNMIIAYEPLFAIGSGHPDTPENANDICGQIHNIIPTATVIYGGSVTSENVRTFTAMEHIAGVLPGGASLDPQEFAQIIQNA